MSTPDLAPFERDRRVHHLITQETRYLIVQYTLAHPENLPTLNELAHAIPRSRSTIHEHVEKLIDEDILAEYTLDERPSRDLPRTFYGFTETGIDAVRQLGMLEGKPVLQAMYEELEKPPDIQRYESAPRPESVPVGGSPGEREEAAS